MTNMTSHIIFWSIRTSFSTAHAYQSLLDVGQVENCKRGKGIRNVGILPMSMSIFNPKMSAFNTYLQKHGEQTNYKALYTG